MTELFGLGLFGLGLGLFGSVFGLRLIMPRVNHKNPSKCQTLNEPSSSSHNPAHTELQALRQRPNLSSVKLP